MKQPAPNRREFCRATAAALGGIAATHAAGESLPDGQPGSPPGGPRLWDQEPSLWEEARRYRLIRPLSPVFGWEGPSGGAFGREYSRQPGWKFTEGIDLAEPGAAVAPWSLVSP